MPRAGLMLDVTTAAPDGLNLTPLIKNIRLIPAGLHVYMYVKKQLCCCYAIQDACMKGCGDSQDRIGRHTNCSHNGYSW